MNFVKETHQHKDRYFFEEESGRKVSPYFPTLQHAKIWRVQYHARNYTGKNRRVGLSDRRSSPESRQQMGVCTWPELNPYGRRRTDYPLQVDKDLTKNHLDRLLEWTRDRRV
jgi:hypothetical protein